MDRQRFGGVWQGDDGEPGQEDYPSVISKDQELSAAYFEERVRVEMGNLRNMTRRDAWKRQ